jgi:hypothetical protein
VLDMGDSSIDKDFIMVYNRAMRNQIIKDSIKIGLLILAILYIFVIALPFIVSDEADRLIIEYGLDDFARQLLGR